MSSTYVLGQDMASYASSSEKRYMYAIRKEEDGTLYIARLDTHSVSDSIELFGDAGSGIPDDFEDMTFPPSEDYHDGRSATTKELTYPRDQVKYEQWRMDNRLLSYYLDSEGNLVISTNVDKPMPINGTLANDDLADLTTDFTYTFNGRYTNTNIRKVLIDEGWNGVSPVVLINNGSITSDKASTPAITFTGSYPGGISLINNGVIIGSSAFTTVDGTYYAPSDAIFTDVEVSITNNSGAIILGGRSLTTADDGYAINGIELVTLINNGTIGSTN